MNFLGNKYYKLSRRLLLMVGLWPYDHSIFKYFQVILCNIIVTLTTIGQIIELIKLRQNIELMMKILSPTVLCLIFTIKYQTFCVISGKLRRLIERVEKDWNILKDKKELDIIERYTYIGSMYGFRFTILGVVGTLVFISMSFTPIILDIFAPLNVSRPRELLFPGEYFIDQKKYFYAISLHLDLTLILIVTTLLGTESLYIIHVQHACGLFQVASYRLNQAFDKNLLQTYTPEKRMIIVCQRITEAVQIHKRALESITRNILATTASQRASFSSSLRFSELLWSSLVVSYSILLIIGITSLIINLFCLFQAVLIVKQMDEVARVSLFIIGHILYLFLGNYVGQILIDHSAGIFEETYFTRWHGAPLQAQKLLPIIMQRSKKSCKMTVAGMFIPSLEGFATLMSTTMSYFTVLWSVNK